MQNASTPVRVAVYVDGFNLYYGMREAGFRSLLWLNIESLAGTLVEAGEALHSVKYFTAITTTGLEKDTPIEAMDRVARQSRQKTYLAALQGNTAIKVILGRFESSEKSCKSCGAPYYRFEEKKTDVSIATHLICDAIEDNYDKAILISADSDLVPAVEAVRRLKPAKVIVAAFPPERKSFELTEVCHGVTNIGRAALSQSQLGSPLKSRTNGELRKPIQWTKNYHGYPRAVSF